VARGVHSGLRPSRRSVLGIAGLAVVAAGCGEEPVNRSDRTIRYGDDASQFAEIFYPDGQSRGVVVVIHGGFWRAAYDASLGRPLAHSLAEEGWTAWNLEYRRVGPAGSGGGGGSPQTLDDVAAGIDALADVDGLDTSRVITLGHSAGGHLATWAASRGRFERWQPERVRVTGVVSQAGVLDLRAAYELGLGGGAVEAFLGHPPGPEDDPVEPLRQVPLDVPVRCIHGRDDTTVPISQSESYVDAATAAGGDAALADVAGDHFVVIDTSSPVWNRQLEILAAL
jgi:acetyl esterase/lipase